MELKQAITEVLEGLPEDRQREVLDFARFITLSRDEEDWRKLGKAALARAYGPDEPDYTEADIKSGEL